MGTGFSALMARTAALAKGAKDEKQKVSTIYQLIQAMHSSDPAQNKTRGAQVLDNKAVIRVLVDLGVGPSSDKVATEALVALVQVTHDDDNGKRLFQEHPGLVPALAAKMESGAGQVPEVALWVLNHLSGNPKINREVFVSNPKLVPQVMAVAESSSGPAQVKALTVLLNFAYNNANEREIFLNYPTLVPLLMGVVKSGAEHARHEALRVLNSLTFNEDSKREMFTNHPALVPLLMAVAESGTKQAQHEALKTLVGLTSHYKNIRPLFVNHPKLFPLMMAVVELGTWQAQTLALVGLWHLSNDDDSSIEILSGCSSKLLPLMAGRMHGDTMLAATSVIYNLSRPAANHAVLRNNGPLMVAALAKGVASGEEYIAMLSVLVLVTLFGADSSAFQINKGMLESVFEFLEDTMLVGSSQISEPLLALRHLCAVESHRQMLWSMYAAAVPFTILEALEQAIQDKNLPAMNDATSILVQFANDPEPLAWMRGNTPALEKVFAQLGPFPEALSAAQMLLRVVEPSF